LDYRGAVSNDWVRGTFVLNESTRPMQMDLTIQEGPPGNTPNTVPIIYERKGDKLKVAVSGNGQRPVDFTPRGPVRIFAFERE
jgi:uncharacterized protein (TIGR03067 family)